MERDTDLIAAIYDAVIDPSGWEEVVKRIVEATKSVSGGLLVLERNAAHLSATHNVDPFYTHAYVEHWHRHNPLRAVEATVSPGELKTATHLFETETFRASAFFNEFLCPQGWADVVGVGLLRGPNSSGHLLVHRSPDAIWVEPKEWHLLETIAPHLKRAAEIHQLLALERGAKESLGAGVAAAGFAVFLLAKDCRVLFANAKAEDLVRCGKGLRYEHGRLAAKNSALTQRLRALAREAARPADADGDVGGTLELPCDEGRPPLAAHVFPLAADRAVFIFDIDRPSVAVFVVDPSTNLGAQVQRFGAKFGLTPAETRVAGEIIGGSGLLAAATRLNITEATARGHAKRIFGKTGTTRQTELIRHFFETTWTLLKTFPIWVSSSSIVRDGLETVGCEGSLDFSMLMIACGG
jgi:DNA-binding CsgD family transcriptional regulator